MDRETNMVVDSVKGLVPTRDGLVDENASAGDMAKRIMPTIAETVITNAIGFEKEAFILIIVSLDNSFL